MYIYIYIYIYIYVSVRNNITWHSFIPHTPIPVDDKTRIPRSRIRIFGRGVAQSYVILILFSHSPGQIIPASVPLKNRAHTLLYGQGCLQLRMGLSKPCKTIVFINILWFPRRQSRWRQIENPGGDKSTILVATNRPARWTTTKIS